MALCLLPYIVFGPNDKIRKRLCQILAVLMFIGLTLGLLYVFYTRGEIQCADCQYIDCVPYTHNMCPTYGNNTSKGL